MQMDLFSGCCEQSGVIGTRSVDTGVNSALMRAQQLALRGARNGL